MNLVVQVLGRMRLRTDRSQRSAVCLAAFTLKFACQDSARKDRFALMQGPGALPVEGFVAPFAEELRAFRTLKSGAGEFAFVTNLDSLVGCRVLRDTLSAQESVGTCVLVQFWASQAFDECLCFSAHRTV